MQIKVIERIGDRATDMQQGDLIHDEIVSGFNLHEIVELDFAGMNTILSMFLNNAIGALYKNYDSSFLNTNLKIKNLGDEDMFILKRVISRAKDFYAQPKTISNALDECM